MKCHCKIIGKCCLFSLFLFSFQVIAWEALDISDISNLPNTQALIPEYKRIQTQKSTILGKEGSVDPKRYIIGPGDEFTISLVNLPSANHKGTVNLNGDLFIPDLG